MQVPDGRPLANHADALPGLSHDEVRARLLRNGPNEIGASEGRTALRIIVETIKEPMLAMLLLGGAIYLILGDTSDAIVLLLFALASVIITFVQELRSERVMEALRDLSSPRALVIRGGERLRVAGRDVVVGDVIVVAEGDRVAADADLLRADNVEADESLLTGESQPVRKQAVQVLIGAKQGAAQNPEQGADKTHANFETLQDADWPDGDIAARRVDDVAATNRVHAGTLIVRGQGLARVIATGRRSAIGRIGETLRRIEPEPPRLRQQTRRAVSVFAMLGLTLSALTALLYALTRGPWLEALLAGIALGMSMLPEEFPVVLMVFMAMGAWRISRANVLTRRAAAIETLGSTTVLCTDKTGTLTQNRMMISAAYAADGLFWTPDAAQGLAAAPEPIRRMIECGMLASAAEPYDPMERAFHDLAREFAGEGKPESAAPRALLRQYALQPDLLAMTQVWRGGPDGAALIVAAKGAPEAIADLCGLDGAARADLHAQVDAMAQDGLRVLGVAHVAQFKPHDASDLPATQRGFDFTFLGLVGLSDPLRVNARDTVRQCREAGIRVVMITGDYPVTAHTIANDAGIDTRRVVTGGEVAALDDAALAALAREASVFARITPDQKLRIVEAFKRDGEIVAMIGDGVNDAPSLKAAHIGVAMGQRGTDVAREASAIVLLNDDFGALIDAVRLGRRIYDNIRKAMGFIFAVHVPIAGMALLPLILGWPIVLWPLHIAFLEMVIDPVCSLVFEAEKEEHDVMTRPPRDPAQELFSKELIIASLFAGLLALMLVGAVYAGAVMRGLPEGEVRALAFFTLILTIAGLVLASRRLSASLGSALLRPNLALGVVAAMVVTVSGLTLWVPMIRDLFRFGPLHGHDMLIAVGAGLILLLILEGAKALVRDRRSRSASAAAR